jgi:hypothetical protein
MDLSNKNRAVCLIFGLMATLFFYAYAGSAPVSFMVGDIVGTVQLVGLQPPPGTYILKEEEEMSVSLFSPFALDIWYTTDGTSPVKNGWIDYDNTNVRNYGGDSIVLTKTATIRYVGISPVFLTLTPIYSARYTIATPPKKEEVKSDVTASTILFNGDTQSVIKNSAASSIQPIIVESIYKKRAAQWNLQALRSTVLQRSYNLQRLFQYGAR